jgi:hypothetical protein
MARMGATAGKRASGYKFTAKRAESLAKARIVSARNRSRGAQRARATAKTLSDSKAKFTPSVRFTRHSQSVKIEGRTRKIPGTSRRFAGSANLRLESIKSQGVADKAIPTIRIRHGAVSSKLANKTLFNKGMTKAAKSRIKTGKAGGRSNAV